MENIEFDKILRDRLEGVTEAAPDVWEGISQGLARRHRRVVMRRFALAATAAAAGLAIALLVIRDPRDSRQPQAPVRTAQALHEELSAPETPEVDVLPIQEQIATFTKNQVTARAVVNKPAAVTETPQPSVEETPVAEEPAASVATEEAPANETIQTQEPQQEHLLTEGELPSDFWSTDDEPRTRKTHTSNISILSNLTTVASDNDLIYKASPMHSSSQTGKGNATSSVEPYSDPDAPVSPKFFSPVSLGLQVEVPVAGRLSVSTGLSYSYLVSQYDMLVDKVLYKGGYNQLHYLGIPLTLSYRFVETEHFGFYGAFGGAVEKCIDQRYVFGSEEPRHEKVNGFQWSARVGMGAEYWFVPRLGLYFDPSLVYFFDNSQPLSIRTQQPFQARFEVGLRFKL